MKASSCGYSGRYEYWQYSWWGDIPGISGDVDMNYQYIPAVHESYTGEAPASVKAGFTKGLPSVSGFARQSATDNTITVKWNKLDDAQKYRLYYAKARNGSYSYVDVEGDQTSYTFQKLYKDMIYYYRIRPYIDDGEDQFWGLTSSIYEFSTSRDKNYRRKVTTDALTIRKYAGTAYGRSGYLAKGKYFVVRGRTRDKSGKIWYKISYNGAVRYVSSSFNKYYVPRAKKPVSISATKNSITLSWRKINYADAYVIYRATSKKGPYKEIATVKEGTTYTNKKLKRRRTYYYKVRAFQKINSKWYGGRYSKRAAVQTK